jgi:hypothetical protein
MAARARSVTIGGKMRLSIVVQLDAAPPAALERRAVPALTPACRHRAPTFPLAPFLAHLAETWLPYSQPWMARTDVPAGAYLPLVRCRPLVINRSV